MPQVPYDILDRIRDLEQQVRDLTGRSQIRPAMNQVLSGDVVVGDGGTFKVNNQVGGTQLYIGGIAPANPDGTPQRGLLLYRQNGSLAMSLANTGSGPMDQTLQVRDKNGNTIFSDDIVTGGLGRPFLPIPLAAGVNFDYTAWTTTHVGQWSVQHPVLAASFSVFAPVGSTAQARLMINFSGSPVQLGSTITASGGNETFANLTLSPADHGRSFGQVASLLLQVQRTAGASPCTVWNQGFYGRF
ncbi:hypothetical protein [Kitasatospora purpeofusca]|uniref:hypothetical protein n=1 Tax=Kitasatospora purpeofusca TaxID=67352 RepID=UPI0036493776